MKKTNFLTICVVLLVLMNAATLFYLFRMRKPEHPAPPPNGGPAAYMIEHLKLNTQQQASFAQLRTEHQDALRKARDEDKKLHQSFFALVKSGKPYGPEADSLISQMAAQRKLIETATYTHFQKLRSLCTDEQKPRLDELIDELGDRIGQSAGGRPGPPHGDGPPPPPNGEHNGPPPHGAPPK